MLRKIAAIIFFVNLLSAGNLEAQSRFEIGMSSGLRFGGSFVNARYRNNSILEDLDVASGLQFDGSFFYPIPAGSPLMLELLVNYQRADLRFKPASISGIPDSILALYEVDGDKLILGDVSVTYIHGGVLYELESNSGWIPHVNFGLGATIWSTANGESNKTKFSVSFGVGTTKMFTETFGSRFQMRGYVTPLPSDVYWSDPGGNTFRTVDRTFFFQGAISGGLVIAF